MLPLIAHSAIDDGLFAWTARADISRQASWWHCRNGWQDSSGTLRFREFCKCQVGVRDTPALNAAQVLGGFFICGTILSHPGAGSGALTRGTSVNRPHSARARVLNNVIEAIFEVMVK